MPDMRDIYGAANRQYVFHGSDRRAIPWTVAVIVAFFLTIVAWASYEHHRCIRSHGAESAECQAD